jgi:hypothetical protein
MDREYLNKHKEILVKLIEKSYHNHDYHAFEKYKKQLNELEEMMAFYKDSIMMFQG